MSADLLREAAAKMRERAEVATRTEMPWDVDEIGAVWAQENDGQPILISSRSTDGDAEHIASWHPTVALAVADWLDQAAIHFEGGSLTVHPITKRAIAVARAYLGREA